MSHINYHLEHTSTQRHSRKHAHKGRAEQPVHPPACTLGQILLFLLIYKTLMSKLILSLWTANGETFHHLSGPGNSPHHVSVHWEFFKKYTEYSEIALPLFNTWLTYMSCFGAWANLWVLKTGMRLNARDFILYLPTGNLYTSLVFWVLAVVRGLLLDGVKLGESLGWQPWFACWGAEWW